MFNLFNLWRSTVRGSAQPQAHMTWASSKMGRSLSRTGVLLKKQLWIWPIIATVALAGLAFGVQRAIENTMKGNLRSQLQSLLNVETAMLVNWMQTQAANATSLANDLQVREEINQILAAEYERESNNTQPLKQRDLHRDLHKRLSPAMSAHNYVGYFVADKARRIVSASYAELIGRTEIPEYEAFIARALKGEATLSPPFASIVPVKDEFGKLRTGVPTMFVAAPVRDASFDVVAVLCLRIRPEQEFTRIMQLGQVGESGETYAFDKSVLRQAW